MTNRQTCLDPGARHGSPIFKSKSDECFDGSCSQTNRPRHQRARATIAELRPVIGRARFVELAAHGLALFFLIAPHAHSFDIETGNPDLKLHWDTTVKYTAAFRLERQSSTLTNNPPTTVNQDDGDRNFARGLISNRVDVLSEADLLYRNVGARVSAAGWYDAIYNRSNDNNSAATANQTSVPFDEFTHATRKVNGRQVELLDAFVFGSGDVDDVKASFRAGRHSIVWGESLFFGGNGIAGAQAPVDVIKLISVPNSQFKETIRPTGQVSGQLQISPRVSLAGYYQYEWEKSRLPGVGSYFSNGDIVDAGGERLLAGGPLVPGGGPAAFFRGVDRSAKDSGQGGLALRLHSPDVDYGLYAIQWHSKTPLVYVRPASFTPSGGPPVIVDPDIFNAVKGQIGEYYLVYPENIRTYGASATTAVGEANIAGEVSVRRNTPLVSNGLTVTPGSAADNDRHPLYAVGNSLHAQASIVWAMGPSVIARSSVFLGEVAWNRLTHITLNPRALDPNATTDAVAFRVVYEPSYRQLLPGVDITVPVGASYSPHGRSSVVAAFAADKGGDINVGLTAAYLEVWRGTLSVTHFYGRVAPNSDAQGHFNYSQSLGDRDYVSMTLRTTF